MFLRVVGVPRRHLARECPGPGPGHRPLAWVSEQGSHGHPIGDGRGAQGEARAVVWRYFVKSIVSTVPLGARVGAVFGHGEGVPRERGQA